ncbi:MAG: DUF1573 domain-containing protein [Rubripirellula sp.]
MKSLPKVLFSSLLACIAFSSAMTAFVSSVGYHPAGVKPHQRQAYAKKMQKAERYQAILDQPDLATSPIAVINQTSFDFGMIDPHTTHSHEFLVSNQGTKPLTLEVTSTSCKCTIGKLKENLVGPGESTSISMTWNTGYQADDYVQTAHVITNDPLAKSIELTVKGEVRAKLIAPERVEFEKTDLGDASQAKFVIYSQLWNTFAVEDIKCGVREFQWYAEPIETNDARLTDTDAKSAWEIRLMATTLDYGKFHGDLWMTVQPGNGDEAIVRKLACEGKIRAPINFYSKEIHPTKGLDIGTLESNKEHNFHLIVRARGDEARKIEVLSVEPEELQATLAPLSSEGAYRLTVKVPTDAPTVIFNGDHQHGFVQVGDPADKRFSNWFPLMGAIVGSDN